MILALKAHYLDQVAREAAAAAGPRDRSSTVQNGIPWWYFHKHGGPLRRAAAETLDPSGLLTKHIDADRIVGCVVYPAAGVTEPGVIHHVEGDRFPGRRARRPRERAGRRLHDLLVEAGFRSRVLDDIRSEIWLKAWGNLSFNPISALTHATLVEICQFADTRRWPPT